MHLKQTIKKVLKEETDPTTSVKRRLKILPMYVRDVYQWLDPKRFDTFEEFINSVIFSTLRDFTSMEITQDNNEELDEIMDEIGPFIENIILNKYQEEIHEYFINERLK